jgi:hypothetical protein
MQLYGDVMKRFHVFFLFLCSKNPMNQRGRKPVWNMAPVSVDGPTANSDGVKTWSL